MAGLQVKYEINLNTIITLISFGTIFSAVIYSYANIQYRQDTLFEHVGEQRELNATFEERFSAVTELMNKLAQGQRDQEFQITTMQRTDSAIEERLNRVTESYSNQFSDLRTQLSSINTQIALANQALQRLEAVQTQGRPGDL